VIAVSYDDISAGILVGGRGERLGGRDKARIYLPNGVSTLRHVAEAVMPNVATTFLLGRPGQIYLEVDCKMLTDTLADRGPLAGLANLLDAAQTPWSFLISCDLPFFDPAIMHRLAKARSSSQKPILVPKTSDGLHPASALYASSLRPIVSERLNDGTLGMHKLLEAVGYEAIPIDQSLEHALTNVNTPDDLASVTKN